MAPKQFWKLRNPVILFVWEWKVAYDKGLGRFVVRVKEIGGRGILNHKHPDVPLVVFAFHTRHKGTVFSRHPKQKSIQGSKLSRSGINRISKYRQNLRPGFLLALISACNLLYHLLLYQYQDRKAERYKTFQWVHNARSGALIWPFFQYCGPATEFSEQKFEGQSNTREWCCTVLTLTCTYCTLYSLTIWVNIIWAFRITEWKACLGITRKTEQQHASINITLWDVSN